MVNNLSRNPGIQSEFLELHALSPAALPAQDDLPMDSAHIPDDYPEEDDTNDTTPLRGTREGGSYIKREQL